MFAPELEERVAFTRTVCITFATVFALEREAYEKFVLDNPETERAILVSSGYNVTEMVQNFDLFSEMDAYKLRALSSLLRIRRFEPQKRIFSQGDWAPKRDGYSMFFVLSGQVQVFLEKDGTTKLLSALSHGACFGELSLLAGIPRGASVASLASRTVMNSRWAAEEEKDPKAVEKSRGVLLLELRYGEFVNFTQFAPEVLDAIKKNIVKYQNIEIDVLFQNDTIAQGFLSFCKKEFSEENMYFWWVCERFRRLLQRRTDIILDASAPKVDLPNALVTIEGKGAKGAVETLLLSPTPLHPASKLPQLDKSAFALNPLSEIVPSPDGKTRGTDATSQLGYYFADIGAHFNIKLHALLKSNASFS